MLEKHGGAFSLALISLNLFCQGAIDFYSYQKARGFVIFQGES